MNLILETITNVIFVSTTSTIILLQLSLKIENILTKKFVSVSSLVSPSILRIFLHLLRAWDISFEFSFVKWTIDFFHYTCGEYARERAGILWPSFYNGEEKRLSILYSWHRNENMFYFSFILSSSSNIVRVQKFYI